MFMKTSTKWCLALLLCQFSLAAQAQDYAGQYTGFFNGDAVSLSLQATNGQYSGILDDGSNKYQVKAVKQDQNLVGSCTEPNLGFSFQMVGMLQGNTLNLQLTLLEVTQELALQKQGAASTAGKTASPPKPDQKQRDPALVGKWTRQENYNSGYGGGYMSNESSLIFLADGRMADGGSRTMVGGSGFSGQSGDKGNGVIAGLTWHTENQQLYLTASENGKTQTQCLGKYGFHENAMMITAKDGTKALFYRN